LKWLKHREWYIFIPKLHNNRLNLTLDFKEANHGQPLTAHYWLDQMSINCGMTRLYGRVFRNERVNSALGNAIDTILHSDIKAGLLIVAIVYEKLKCYNIKNFAYNTSTSS